MSKLIPVLIDKFDFEIVSSPAKEGDWETENFWFVKPHNLKVRVYERSKEQINEYKIPRYSSVDND